MKIFFSIIALLFVFPPIITYLVFRVFRRPLRNRKRAVHFAAEWTAPLYMVAVTFILSGIARHGLGPWMFILLLVIFTLFVISRVRREGEFLFGELVRRFLRASFLIFFVLYFILALVSILMDIF